jgi:hypothetical protein
MRPFARTCKHADHGGLAGSVGTQHGNSRRQGDVNGHIGQGGLGGTRVCEANLHVYVAQYVSVHMSWF